MLFCGLSVAWLPNADESGKQSLYADSDPDHHQNLIIGPLPTFPANFMPIRLKFLCKVANKETYKQ